MRKQSYVIGFAFYITFCGILYFCYLYINNLKYNICPAEEYILAFQDHDDITIRLWSYLTIWAISIYLPIWRPYAPLNALQLLSTIYDNSRLHMKDFNALSIDCQQYGELYHAGKFKVINIVNEPLKYADLVFMLKERIKEQFVFSKDIEIEVTSFINRELERKAFQDILVKDLVMVVINEGTKNNENLTNFYLKQTKELIDTKYSLVIVLGDKSIYESLYNNNDRIVEAFEFSTPQSLYFASICHHLIIDNSAQSLLYSLFNHKHTYIYQPQEPLRSLTQDLESWHHHE